MSRLLLNEVISLAHMTLAECAWSTYRLSRVILIVFRKSSPTWVVFSGDSAASFTTKEVSHFVGIIHVRGVDGSSFRKAVRVMQAVGVAK